LASIFVVTTSLIKHRVIYAPAAFLGSSGRFSGPSPESNPNSPLPVISLVVRDTTISLIGQSFFWFIAESIVMSPLVCDSLENLLAKILVFLSSFILFNGVLRLPLRPCFVRVGFFSPLLPPLPRSQALANYFELTNAAFSFILPLCLRSLVLLRIRHLFHVLALQLTGLSIYFVSSPN